PEPFVDERQPVAMDERSGYVAQRGDACERHRDVRIVELSSRAPRRARAREPVRRPALRDRVTRVPLAFRLLSRPWRGAGAGQQLLRPRRMQRRLAAETVEDEQQ